MHWGISSAAGKADDGRVSFPTLWAKPFIVALAEPIRADLATSKTARRCTAMLRRARPRWRGSPRVGGGSDLNDVRPWGVKRTSNETAACFGPPLLTHM